MKKLLLCCVLLLFTLSAQAEAANSLNQQPDLNNIGGDFVLHSTKGDVALKDFRGKVVLLYFGYINCPDACPTTLSQWTKAFRKLSKEDVEKVQGIMVSVDPERDTLFKLELFTEFFHENIVGVSGSLNELRAVTKMYGTEFTIQAHEPGKNYGVDHSFHVYVIGQSGKVVDRIDFTLAVDKLVDILQRHLND